MKLFPAKLIQNDLQYKEQSRENSLLLQPGGFKIETFSPDNRHWKYFIASTPQSDPLVCCGECLCMFKLHVIFWRSSSFACGHMSSLSNSFSMFCKTIWNAVSVPPNPLSTMNHKQSFHAPSNPIHNKPGAIVSHALSHKPCLLAASQLVDYVGISLPRTVSI